MTTRIKIENLPDSKHNVDIYFSGQARVLRPGEVDYVTIWAGGMPLLAIEGSRIVEPRQEFSFDNG